MKGHGKGKYRGVRQETFITPEAKRELQKYREWMTKRNGYDWSDDDFVFLDLRKPYSKLTYQGMATAVQAISKRAKIPFSTHDGRRIVETALENVGIPRNWIQKIKGRKVRGEDAPYSRPAIEMLREKYRQALPDLEFMEFSSKSEAGEEFKQRMEKSEAEANYLRKEMETLKSRIGFIDKYIGLADVIETKSDQRKLLNLLETMRAEKLEKERVKEHQNDQEQQAKILEQR